MRRIFFSVLFCSGLVVLGLSLAAIRPSESTTEHINAHRSTLSVQVGRAAVGEGSQVIKVDVELAIIGASEFLLNYDNNNVYKISLYRSDDLRFLESQVTPSSVKLVDNFKEGYSTLEFQFNLEPTDVSTTLTDGELIRGILVISDEISQRTVSVELPESMLLP